MMNRVSVKGAITSMMNQTTPPWVSTEALNSLLASLTKTDGLVDEIGLAEDKIRNDKKLSDSGKQEQVKGLAVQSVPKFAPLGRVNGDARAAYAQLTNILIGPITAIPKGVNEVVDFLKLQEDRKGIGKAAAPLAYLKSLETDNLETARALVSAPGGSWIPADIRARGEEEFARRTNPTVFEQRRSIEYLRDHLLALAELLRQWLVGLGANPETVAKTLGLK